MTTTPATDVTVALRPAVDADIDELASMWFLGWRDGHLGHVPTRFCRTAAGSRSAAASRIRF